LTFHADACKIVLDAAAECCIALSFHLWHAATRRFSSQPVSLLFDYTNTPLVFSHAAVTILNTDAAAATPRLPRSTRPVIVTRPSPRRHRGQIATSVTAARYRHHRLMSKGGEAACVLKVTPILLMRRHLRRV